MTIKSISPSEAQALTFNGAVLIDIREEDEHLRENISSSRHHALSKIGSTPIGVDEPVIFYCRSGNRTAVNAAKLRNAVKHAEVFVLEGGIDAWRAAKMPISKNPKQPIELNRQVQIGAGGLVVAGWALGALVHAGFYTIPAFVGLGLIFAGVSGYCGLARILAIAPWNRKIT
jgi:rhodanese-related sulfurtransferase